jgi:Skp family chaperone for outer membrane proteins
MTYGLRLFGVGLIAATMIFAGPASAQQPAQIPEATAPLTIGVVDVPYIMQNSAAAKGIRTQIAKDEAAYKADFAKRDGALRAAYQDLQSQLTLLGPDAQRDRRVAFEQRAADFEREVDFRKKDLQNRENNALKKVEDTLKSTLQGLITERKVTLLLHKGAIVHFESQMDLTGEAMKRLNAKLPSVKVDPPSPLPKAPVAKAAPAQAPKGK